MASSAGPVGVCIVRWDGPFDARVAELWPGCVEVTISTCCRRRATAASAARSSPQPRHAAPSVNIALIGIGVADDNSEAARLYERLGYTDSGTRYVTDYEYTDVGAATIRAHERNRFLLKSPRPTTGSG